MSQDSNKRVLYVDDEESNVFMFKLLFKDSFDLITASSGPDGLDILQSDPTISVVVSDMNMPKMTGLEFIDKARKVYKDITFFILSGYTINDHIKSALSGGWLSGYMTKPIQSEEMQNAIESALAEAV